MFKKKDSFAMATLDAEQPWRDFQSGTTSATLQFGVQTPDGNVVWHRSTDYSDLGTVEGRESWLENVRKTLRAQGIPVTDFLLPVFLMRTATTTYSDVEVIR